jgi:DUF438 domain-containing protein
MLASIETSDWLFVSRETVTLRERVQQDHITAMFLAQDMLKLFDAGVKIVDEGFLVFNEYDAILLKTLPVDMFSAESARLVLFYDINQMVQLGFSDSKIRTEIENNAENYRL